MNKMTKSKGTKIAVNAFLLLTTLVVLIPLWIVLVNSFKPGLEAAELGLNLPRSFTLKNYETVFLEGKIIRSFLSGVSTTVVATIVIVVLSSMASFTIARSKTKTAAYSYYVFVVGLIVPVAIIPTYLVLKLLNLLATYPGVVLIYITYSLSFSIFLYTGFIKTISVQMDEAAWIDGCGPVRLFFGIIFPLLKPVTVTVIIFNFMAIWNDVIVQLYFSSSKRWTMPMTMYSFFGKYSNTWNLLFADIVLVVLPVMALYIALQKYFISGLTAGAVKG